MKNTIDEFRIIVLKECLIKIAAKPKKKKKLQFEKLNNMQKNLDLVI